ncbi:response regulator transcription factor [Acetanaerobacterium elongatum]|uniref:Stage 0 sporulation protein A homolog n=1 Tax=Acetanaerobacterium elongatum TaxID=258515 RepID=A0A1G9WBJ8_9FIRM|nr:response regulator transcription factor [Acetanaerobacterium elongatum]SDM81697.1 DNA-binding response regulator, OmpR family, contains REC and winged-helix (wHTH) domain [Acetanaerobacterium elongatum]
MRILMIEDDKDLCAAVIQQLRQAGYETDTCHNGEDGLYYLNQGLYDACLLDRMLPGLDGLSLLNAARSKGITTPVLMLTAMGRIGDRVDGLDAGADDYLVKPFDMRELLARVRALCRRPANTEPDGLKQFADITLDTAQLILNGPKGQCTLSKKESELLAALISNSGQTLSRTILFGKIWGPDTEVEEAILDSYIHFVRRRIRVVGASAIVTTVRGIGYRMENAK